MMKNDLLLQDDLAKELYSRASSLPLIDYHNHLSIPALAENRTEPDPAALWLTCDPYKHRAMRICGVEEKYITGDTDAVPEGEAVTCDLLMLPIGGTYTMTAEQAAAFTDKVSPKAVIPTHYGSIVGSEEDVVVFEKALTGEIPVIRKLFLA